MDKGKDTGNGAVKTPPPPLSHPFYSLDTHLFGSVFSRVPQYSHLQFVHMCSVE